MMATNRSVSSPIHRLPMALLFLWLTLASQGLTVMGFAPSPRGAAFVRRLDPSRLHAFFDENSASSSTKDSEVTWPIAAGAFLSTFSFMTPSWSAATESLPSISEASTTVAQVDVRAEVLTDLAHVCLDLFTFYGPAKLATRLFAVVGRILTMGADYVPDHFILPEEIAFQLFMLLVASIGLFQAVQPQIAAGLADHNMTARDNKAFTDLLEPSGLTWSQYKYLHAAGILDWIYSPPGTIVTEEDAEDEYAYWLFAGDAVVSHQNKTMYQISHNKTEEGGPGVGLLGEAHLMRRLDAIKGKTKPRVYLQTTAHAGGSGATLLRIHTSKLVDHMSKDSDLNENIRDLLLQSMQTKLTFQLAS